MAFCYNILMKQVLKFPENFLWGAASASYQVEGGIYNNDWAEAARLGKVPHAGESTDHYNRYEADFDLARSLGHNAHRISIEWSRIEPEEGKFNLEEIEHYKKVLTALRARGLKSMVTLWHFTIPIWFSDMGGFTNRQAPKYFARYAEFVTKHLHEYADMFDTMNEPMVYASNGFRNGQWPPFKKNYFVFLRVIKNLMRSHNLAYRTIKKNLPQINLGIVKNNMQFSSDWKPWNWAVSKFMTWFWNMRFLNAVHKNCDHIGLNYYFHAHVGRSLGLPKNDFGWEYDPSGLYHVLIALKRYNKPVYVTEAGIADRADSMRPKYIRGLVLWAHNALQKGLDLRGFMYWSFADNFEWAAGYTQEFGMVHIDQKTLERKPRESAYVYKTICESNALTIE